MVGHLGSFLERKVTDVIQTKKVKDDKTGDVTFERCGAKKIRVKTDTGRVQGTLLGEMVFYAKTDTGKVRVPKSTTGGLCEITTDTGDIIFSIIGK